MLETILREINEGYSFRGMSAKPALSFLLLITLSLFVLLLLAASLPNLTQPTVSIILIHGADNVKHKTEFLLKRNTLDGLKERFWG
jgi:hypothetical protein